MTELHPFAKFIAILARGKTHIRSFTVAEAEEAMTMLLRGKTEPEQIGAFLMLLRLKEESPEEIAGFVRGVGTTLQLPDEVPEVDLDWSSYAGKRRQLPWFLLSALVLVRSGIRVFMHGAEGHTPGRLYTRDCLEQLGLPVAGSLSEAAGHISRFNFAYVPLQHISPKLKELIELRPLLGLRSPIHTLSRMINPFDAPCMFQGIFHRGFMETHKGAALLLNQPHMAVFRGEGGEIERRPGKTCEVWSVDHGKTEVTRWPALLEDPRQPEDSDMKVELLSTVWRGDAENAYGEASVVGTLAIALKLLGRVATVTEAEAMAARMWASRDTSQLALVS
ncbi:MAG: glycosyl transferase family protein [Alphaproteobacteria bacterium]|nr:glycosyl transferase family protein [Alphaproteobacteria bacterium]